MAFPASTLNLGRALAEAMETMRTLDKHAASYQSRMAAGNVAANEILGLWEWLKGVRAKLAGYAATPGLGDYAKAQLSDPTLDIGAEFTAVMEAIDDVTESIESTFPKDGSGFLLARQIGASAFTWRQFTPAQTSTLQGLLGSISAAID